VCMCMCKVVQPTVRWAWSVVYLVAVSLSCASAILDLAFLSVRASSANEPAVSSHQPARWSNDDAAFSTAEKSLAIAANTCLNISNMKDS